MDGSWIGNPSQNGMVLFGSLLEMEYILGCALSEGILFLNIWC